MKTILNRFRRLTFGLGALSFLTWIIFSIITPFTNLFNNGYNIFNTIHTVSLLTWVIIVTSKTLTNKQNRKDFKQKLVDFFSDKKVGEEEKPLRKGCSSCKKKAQSN
jgi:hypothetical protein